MRATYSIFTDICNILFSVGKGLFKLPRKHLALFENCSEAMRLKKGLAFRARWKLMLQEFQRRVFKDCKPQKRPETISADRIYVWQMPFLWFRNRRGNSKID